jgi:hypothetical protein
MTRTAKSGAVMEAFRFFLQLLVVPWFSLVAGMVCAAEFLR